MSAVENARDQTWQLDGLCREIDDDSFYPQPKTSIIEIRKTIKVCEACPVRAECLEAALVRNDQFGIWGGLLPKQRSLLRRQQRSA